MSILPAHLTRPLEGGPSFALSHRLFRLCWQAAWLLLAAWTPPPMRRWRRRVLILFGAELGRNADVRASARVWYPPNLSMGDCALIGPGAICYNIAPIALGERTVVSQRAHLCTGSHDLADADFQLTARPIRLGDRAWIAAEAFVGPGVRAGTGAVLGARGVTFADLAPWTVYAGNPARVVKTRRLGPGGHSVSAQSGPKSHILLKLDRGQETFSSPQSY